MFTILSKIFNVDSCLFSLITNLDCFYHVIRKRKVRGLFGYWTDALYSIDIEYYEGFLKQQKKDGKTVSKQPQQSVMTFTTTATTANGANGTDLDEELPDVDPSHEQLNLPANSITLWRILPKLDYAPQVRDSWFENVLTMDCGLFLF